MHGSASDPAVKHSVLFVAEAVTLAHVARPLALASGLDGHSYTITFACDPRFQQIIDTSRFSIEPISSISSEQFIGNLAKGRPLYDIKTLRQYVEADLDLLRRTRPGLVIGDFRLSLSVSARVLGIPYIAITSAYWSPFARQRFPLPELPVNRLFGLKIAGAVFSLVRPAAFAYHAIPLNRVRREYGQPALGYDLRRVYTDADYTVYGDIPELFPTYGLPDNHRYLGAILWSPACDLPSWWDSLPDDRPLVYITLGSSGNSELLPVVFEALAGLPVTVIAATAGRACPAQVPGNVFMADYLPGEQAAARSSLVICNGGSLTAQQALVAGVPVLGITSNMDQQLNMQAIVGAGAGRMMRQSQASVQALRDTVGQMTGSESYVQAAAGLADMFSRYHAAQRFRTLVAEVIDRGAGAAAA